MDVINVAAQEKLVTGFSMDNGGNGGLAPNKRVGMGKWSNTAAQITRVDVTTATNTYGVVSELIVLGHD